MKKDKYKFCNDVIIIGQQPWDIDLGSNCKNIALELSKHSRVLYVNSPLDRITLYRTKNEERTQRRLDVINGKTEGLIHIQDNLWNFFPDCMVESINWIGNDYLFKVANKINNYRFAKSIQRALEELDFNNFILFNDNEMFKGFYLKKFLNPFLSIYYSRDYMIAVDYWKKHGQTIEPELIALNDLCVANSTFLAEYCQKFNSNSYYIGQGCDLDIFVKNKNLVFPEDIILLNKPIIGYVGALQSIRLDIELLAFLARSKPEWSIVLVGPEDGTFMDSELHQIDNVFFLGKKPIAELSDYINCFDVCINPQLVNEVTIGNYPRKIDEYLAVGKPVVATATKAMETFTSAVYLANSKDEYLTLIQKALEENSEELELKRTSFAMEHTWENSVQAIYRSVFLTQQQNLIP